MRGRSSKSFILVRGIMVSFNLKVLAKFGLCSNCPQKLDGCSRARARKIFATACQMLVLAKINTLLACSQMLAKTILYTSCPLQENYSCQASESALRLFCKTRRLTNIN